MSMRCSVAAPDRPGVVDVEVTGPVGCTFDDVRVRLLECAGLPEDAALLVGSHLVDKETRWGLPPLLQGCLLVATGSRAGPVAGSRTGGSGLLVADVVGGPDSGRRYPLRPGDHVIGRASSAAVRVLDPAVSRHHAVLCVGPDGMRISDLGSANGTDVEGAPVPATHSTLRPGQRIHVGRSTLVIREPETRPAITAATGDGFLLVHRPPRRVPPDSPVVVRRPRPPDRPVRHRFSWLAMVLPVLVAVPLATLAHQPMFLLFALLSPVVMLGNALGDRWGRRREHRDAMRAWEVADHRATMSLAQAQAAEVTLRRQAAGDPVELLATVETPSTRLWERTLDAEDLLQLAVGTGRVPSSTQVEDGQERVAQWLADAPFVIRVTECGHVGITGARERVLGLARWLVGQVLARHGPGSIQIVLLAADAVVAVWSWLRWVPHLRRMSTEELEAEVARRAERSPPGSPSSRAVEQTRLFVVADEAEPSRDRLQLTLREGPRVGVHLLWLAAASDALPSGCGVVVEVQASGVAAVHRTGAEPTSVVVDGVAEGWGWRLARGLAPLRETGPDPASSGLPTSAALLDLHEVDLANPSAVVRAWSQVPRSTSAPVGVGAHGVVSIDLRRDGPHALVGGTTGSGKSELLRTLVTSLALRNRPDELSFVLVDYKGGATFAGCSQLPHVAGVITDLDAHLAARALASLQAELTRRERQLAEVGARDLEEYQEKPPSSTRSAVPRLVLVVDEFGVLARELPTFLDGLVRLAAVGRSLGVHLILATQRPAGVVSADIQANVNLRIALRVRDRTDSQDVLDAPDAASLPEHLPGRALARTGVGPLTAFQVALLCDRGTRHVAQEAGVRLVEWEAVQPLAVDRLRPNGAPDGVLSEVAAAACEATRRLDIRIPSSPWLAPLPERLLAAELHGPPEAVPLGLVDLPHLQAQPALLWHPVQDGHLGVVGGQSSGRTTVLASLAVGLARRWAPGRLALHVVDVGGSLHDLRRLPHIGTLIGHDHPALVARLVERLSEQLAERQRHPNGGSGQGSDGGDTRRYVVLLIDGWEAVLTALQAVDHGRAVDNLLALVRDGASAGLRVALSGGREVLLGRVTPLLAERLVLRTGDSTDLLLAGVRADAMPTHQPPGRAVRASDGAHVQVALPGERSLADAVAEAVTHAKGRWGDGPASQMPRLRPLPTSVQTGDLLARWASASSVGRRCALLGVGGDEASLCGLDLDTDPVAVVSGPAGGGRTTALRTMATALTAAGASVVTISPRKEGELAGPWPSCSADTPKTLSRLLADEPRTCVLVDDVELLADQEVEPVLVELARRRGPTSVVVAGDAATLLHAFRGVGAAARSARTGLLLQPTAPGDGEVLGVRVQLPDERVPGRGVLVVRGRQQPVQVAQ